MSRKLTGLPAAIDRRSLLLWGVPLLGVNRSAPVWLLGSRTTGQNTPSAHSDKLEHIFELGERVIDLDAPRTKYTNERYVCNDPRPDLITARHVLMHFTGLPKWPSLTVRWQSTSSQPEIQLFREGYSYRQFCHHPSDRPRR